MSHRLPEGGRLVERTRVQTFIADSVYRISGSTALRLMVVIVLIGGSLAATWSLLTPPG